MLSELHYRLDSINRWLEFAEKKNAALFLANIAIMVGLFETNTFDFASAIDYYLILSVISLALSAFCCIISFIPQIKLKRLYIKVEVKNEDNLLFFGHIAKYSSHKYIERLYSKAGNSYQRKPLEEEYAEQLIINSRIALKKFELFSLGVWFIFAAIFTPLIFIFYNSEAN